MTQALEFATPEIPLEAIDRQWNLRGDIGDTTELEGSIENLGLIEPLVVRANSDGRYTLLAGFRRIAALENLGHNTVPVRVVDHADEDPDTSRISLQLVENLQRVDLTPLEEASGYAQLKKYGWKQKEIARRVGRSEAHISKRLALLDLPSKALDLADAGRLTNESLYELSRVASAGGDAEALVDQLAENHEDDDEPITTEEVGVMAKHVLRDAKALEELSARKTEYEEQGIRIKVVETDTYGIPQLPKDRLGYGNGLDLDHDAHLKEPCALLCLYTKWDTVYESQHCTDRRRHAADGASDLKLPTKADRPKDPYADAKAEARRRRQALNAATEAALDGRQPARDRILDRMAVLYLDRLDANSHNEAAKFLGVASELEGEHKGLQRLYEEADSANRTRILFAAVLAHGNQMSAGTHVLPDEGHLEFLADIGQPIDLDKIARGAEIDSVVEDAIAEGKEMGL